MKKLFCLALFAIGFFVSVEAQATLNYYLENSSSTDTWFFKMADSNGNVQNTVTLAPGGNFSGTFTNFVLPIEWKAQDSNGCGTSGVINAPGGPVYPPVLCTTPAGIKYQLSQPGLLSYQLDFGFN